jgi:hypothetical protein
MKAATLTFGLMLSIAVAACDAPADHLSNQTHDTAAMSAPVNDAESACAAATARVTAERGLPISHVAACDPNADVPELPGYYVLALRAYCREELCGSTNMAWFAVQKTTGNVFEINDVGDWTLGRRVTGGA